MKKLKSWTTLEDYDLHCLHPSIDALNSSVDALQIAAGLAAEEPAAHESLRLLRSKLRTNSRAALQQDGLLSAVFAVSRN